VFCVLLVASIVLTVVLYRRSHRKPPLAGE
jgi:hypothetical protein